LRNAQLNFDDAQLDVDRILLGFVSAKKLRLGRLRKRPRRIF